MLHKAGLFRANKSHGRREAADLGSSATNTVRAMWLDFERPKQPSADDLVQQLKQKAADPEPLDRLLLQGMIDKHR